MTLPNNTNSNEQKPKLINILSTKNDINKTEENEKNLFQDSQRIKKEYSHIQIEYVKNARLDDETMLRNMKNTI